MKRNTKKIFMKGVAIGIATTLSLGGLIQLRFKTPKIIDYMIVYAGEGDTLTGICQEKYSSEIRNQIGLDTLINNCLEETQDGVLKIGERILVPVYKEVK